MQIPMIREPYTMKGQHINMKYSSIKMLLWDFMIEFFPEKTKLAKLTFFIDFYY